MTNWIQKTAVFLPFLLLAAITACDTTNDNANQPVMSLSATSTTGTQPKAPSSIQSGHVTITAAKFLLKEIEFSSDLNDDGLPDDSLDFETDMVVVNLSLDGTLNEIIVKEIPPRRYDEVEFEIHKPEDFETPPDPDFKEGTSGDQRFSVIIEGTFNQQSFTYKSRVNMSQEHEFATPLLVEEGQEVNVTLLVDISQWFVDANGNDLDPTDPNNASEIDESIERSVELFEDNDEDGVED
ncbi:MAG: hypothetical protein R3211_00270 [Balneolaceae bacterium]|nr:hypothetical protein [Balneolaceae bacterium]